MKWLGGVCNEAERTTTDIQTEILKNNTKTTFLREREKKAIDEGRIQFNFFHVYNLGKTVLVSHRLSVTDREITYTLFLSILQWGFPGGSDGKESACNEGDLGLIPELGRSPGGGHGNPFQYSCLENPHGLVSYSPWGPKSQTQLSD